MLQIGFGIEIEKESRDPAGGARRYFPWLGTRSLGTIEWRPGSKGHRFLPTGFEFLSADQLHAIGRFMQDLKGEQ